MSNLEEKLKCIADAIADLKARLDENSLVEFRILSDRATSEFLGLSWASWQRLKHRGEGPPHVMLGLRRIGYRLHDVRKWQDERLRK